ncbi:MAG: phage tail protein [Bacillota bacterium]|uniref:phage tail protein n=1 Tax=Bacillus subtilis group TaxID=653685 RepID=UPI0013537EA0|nr:MULTISPECIES: hypothetical protein [Bacillus subtilis group]MCY8022001.1 hypothetical protein [Bacillus licheniformis]MED4302283.1 hypothetical protein [Bacillus licheniformis]TWL69343.1 hypothetical protein CHCC15318_2085 [Bacillus licheniformis]TWM27782.1 hypothetical protein CHCC14821_3948 [Bacillus paralicheniformis]
MIERLTAIVDAEIGKFNRAMARVKATARSVPNRIVVAVEARTEVFERRMNRLSRMINSFQTVFGNAFGGMKMSIFPALVPVIASLTAAIGSLGPVVGVATGGLMGLASAFGTAGAGAGAFGALAVSNIKGVFEASSNLEKLQKKLDETTDLKQRAKIMEQIKTIQQSLNAEEKKALSTLESFKSNWQDISKSVQKPILQTFINSLNSFKSILNTLRPMFKSVAQAGLELSESFKNSLNAPDVQKFFDYLNKNAGPQFLTMTKTMGNYLRGFLNLMVAFGPLGEKMSASMLKSSEAFAKWTASLSGSDKFKSFIQYVQQNGPKLLTIFKNIGSGLVGIFTAFAPMSSDMLTGLVDLTARFKEWGNSLSESKSFQEFINYVRQNTPTVLSLIGELSNLIVNLGVGMAPLGSQILQMVTSFLKFSNSMMESNPIIGQMIGYLVTFAGLFRALTPLTIAFSAAFKWKDAISTVKKLGTTIKWIGSVIGMVGKAFLTNPILMVVAAIAAAAYLIITNWGPISEFFSGLWEGIKTFAIDTWNSISEFFSSTWQWISDTASQIWGSISSFFSGLWSGISDGVKTAWESIKSFFVGLWNETVSVGKTIWNSLKTFFTGFWNGIKGFFSSIWSGIKSAVVTIWKGIVSVGKNVWNGLKSFFTNVLNGWKKIFSTVWNAIKSTVTSVWNGIVSVGKKVWNGLKSFLTSLINGLKNSFSKIWSNIKNTIVSVWNKVSSTTKNVWNVVKTFLSNTVGKIWTTIKEKFQSIVSSVGEKMNAARDKIKSIWDKVIGFFKGIDLKRIGKDIIQGLINGIGSMANAVWRKVGDIADGVKKKITGLLNIHSPSRWMRDHVGKMIPAGVAVGIDKAGGLVEKATQKLAQLTMFTPDQTTFAYDTALSSGTLNDVRGQIEAEVSDFEISDRPIIIEMDGREVGRGTYKYVKEFQSREDGRRTTINR